MFSHINDMNERGRERDREWGDREKIALLTFNCTCFFITLEFLTPTLSRCKTEIKKTEETACSETAIKFSTDSPCPKFLYLSMHL